MPRRHPGSSAAPPAGAGHGRGLRPERLLAAGIRIGCACRVGCGPSCAEQPGRKASLSSAITFIAMAAGRRPARARPGCGPGHLARPASAAPRRARSSVQSACGLIRSGGPVISQGARAGPGADGGDDQVLAHQPGPGGGHRESCGLTGGACGSGWRRGEGGDSHGLAGGDPLAARAASACRALASFSARHLDIEHRLENRNG